MAETIPLILYETIRRELEYSEVDGNFKSLRSAVAQFLLAGAAGIYVTGGFIDANNHVIFNLSNGSTIDFGTIALSAIYTKSETDTRIQAYIANLVGTAPAALDTIYEIAARVISDESTLAALVNTIAAKASLDAFNTHVANVLIHHSHENKLVLDGLSDVGGALAYLGQLVGMNVDRAARAAWMGIFVGTQAEIDALATGQRLTYAEWAAGGNGYWQAIVLPTAGGDGTALPTGVGGTSAAGTPTETADASSTLPGVEGQGDVGAPTPSGSTANDGNVAISGVSATSAVEPPTESADAGVAPSGVAAASSTTDPSAAGTLAIDANAAVTGVEGITGVGVPSASGTVVIPNYGYTLTAPAVSSSTIKHGIADSIALVGNNGSSAVVGYKAITTGANDSVLTMEKWFYVGSNAPDAALIEHRIFELSLDSSITSTQYFALGLRNDSTSFDSEGGVYSNTQTFTINGVDQILTSYISGQWYRVKVELTIGGTVTVTHYNAAGTQLKQLAGIAYMNALPANTTVYDLLTTMGTSAAATTYLGDITP